jgi:uncharacterized spore protein YtfJ
MFLKQLDTVSVQEPLSSGQPVTEEIDRVTALIGKYANSAAVFGEPVQQDGTLVIPAAHLVWGFGGGRSLEDSRGSSAGSGAGGGAMVTPHGIIEIRRGRVRYHLARSGTKAFFVGAAVGAILMGLLLRNGNSPTTGCGRAR